LRRAIRQAARISDRRRVDQAAAPARRFRRHHYRVGPHRAGVLVDDRARIMLSRIGVGNFDIAHFAIRPRGHCRQDLD
jgi:hypothetical protein